jgi:hypothetical protein
MEGPEQRYVGTEGLALSESEELHYPGTIEWFAEPQQRAARGFFSSLGPDEIRLLQTLYIHSSSNRATWKSEDWFRQTAWEAWLEGVLRIEVNLRPAGRAILHDPEAGAHGMTGDPPTSARIPGTGFRVEIYWNRATGANVPTRIEIVADPSGSLAYLGNTIALDRYLAAFALRIRSAQTSAFAKVPRRRPAPGQPIDVPFYRQLIEAEKALRREGFRGPAKELARRMGENHSTVKSWLRRGRQYVGEEQ